MAPIRKDELRLKEHIQHKLLVMSGKRGVGQTSVSVAETVSDSNTFKAAIPLAGGRLGHRFGHGEQFAVIRVKEGLMDRKELHTPPPHEPGVLPRWLGDLGVNLIFPGGMGQRLTCRLGDRTRRKNQGVNRVKNRFPRLRTIWLGTVALALVAGLPRTAHALQSHGHPEGLYVHQMAHVLFVLAMMFLLYHLRKEQLPGLRWFTWAGVLFVFWNLNALVGHTAAIYVDPQDFLGGPADFSRRLLMSGPAAWTYYATKLDHLILVPAFILLCLGFRALARTPRPLERK